MKLLSFDFIIDWICFFGVGGFADCCYYIVIFSLFVVCIDTCWSKFKFWYTGLFYTLDYYYTSFIIGDMDFNWDLKGCSKYGFLFFFALLNYFSIIFFQFTWLHFSVLFDLFNLFLFIWPLFFAYCLAFIIEYGFSFVSFIIGNSWVRCWYISDFLEWFSYHIHVYFRLIFGETLFCKLLCVSIYSVIWPIIYLYIMIIGFIYLLYIPIACFVRYVSVFTALSVLFNVWVTSCFFICTNCFGFLSGFLVIPSWFFFCILFIGFEGCYVIIHIVLLSMLYIKITSVVLLHKRYIFFTSESTSNYISYITHFNYITFIF